MPDTPTADAAPQSEVVFRLEDPQSLTGTDQAEITLHARPGTNLLRLALDNHIQIEHACGGVCACSTCHVHVVEGMDCLTPASDEELDRVDEAPGIDINSRLACQAEIVRPGKIVVVVPEWNRNAVKETPHD